MEAGHPVARRTREEVAADRGMKKARRTAQLMWRAKQLKSQIEKINQQVDALTPEVLTFFEEQGLPRLTLETPARTLTLHRRSEVWAAPVKGEDGEATPETLEALAQVLTGLEIKADEVIRLQCNRSRLSAIVREIVTEAKEKEGIKAAGRDAASFLPEALSPLVEIAETTKLGFRSSLPRKRKVEDDGEG
jgi:hypothetical protein